MYTKLPGGFLNLLFKGLPGVLVILGSFLLVFFPYFFSGNAMPVAAGIFSEMVKIPLDFIDLKVYRFPLETENYLLFQNFESLPPATFPHVTLAFGLALWLLLGIGVSMISMLQRMQFVLAMVLVTFLLTLTGVNSLNIGGINTNLPMMFLIAGFVLPAAVIHTFFDHWTAQKRTAVILPVILLIFPVLVWVGDAPAGELVISENISMLGLAVAALFMLYIGHVVISSIFVLLAKLNQGVGIRISWHLGILSLIYIAFCFFLLLKLTGNIPFDVPSPPIALLLVPVGILGYYENKRKIQQIQQPYSFEVIGEGLYLIGFAVTVLAFLKGEFSVNRPMVDFLSHVFVYSQLAFSMLFYAYLVANFSGLMDRGSQAEKIMFKPKFFAYYHMRIGSILAMLSLVVFADGIIGVQFSTASTNVSADYYYAVNRPREAAILYENSWQRYRRNEKAIHAVAHLELRQNQPTFAINTLVRSFENNPSVNDILLLSSLLQRGDRNEEALRVLESGLDYFPGNAFLMNNMALLYSGNGRGEMAFNLLDQIAGEDEVAIANKIGLQAKHLIRYDEVLEYSRGLLARINQLAFLNLRGEDADFTVENVRDNVPLIASAVLRNQWSNTSTAHIAEDMAHVDTLLAQNPTPALGADLRETRVIRSYQDGYINESLKYINGLAFEYNRSAGFYHSMAANILMGELDFEKAAVELVQAEERGFRNIKTHHLTVLLFGGQEVKASEISERQGVPFSEWINFDGDGGLVPNDTTVFFTRLSALHKQVKRDFLQGLQEVKHPEFKGFLAYQILLRKGHWLEADEINDLQALIDRHITGKNHDFYKELMGFYRKENIPESRLFNPELSLERNAYWTPLVFLALDQAGDNLERYNILLEASNFNKDPLLWVNLVKYSRMIGVDSYASSTLRKMGEWVDAETLEELQLQNL